VFARHKNAVFRSTWPRPNRVTSATLVIRYPLRSVLRLCRDEGGFSRLHPKSRIRCRSQRFLRLVQQDHEAVEPVISDSHRDAGDASARQFRSWREAWGNVVASRVPGGFSEHPQLKLADPLADVGIPETGWFFR